MPRRDDRGTIIGSFRRESAPFRHRSPIPRSASSATVATARITVTPLSPHIGAARLQGDGEVGGFRGDVETGGDSHAFERLLPLEPFADEPQDRHSGLGPFDLEFALVGQLNVFHIVIHGSPPRLAVSVTLSCRKKGAGHEPVPLLVSVWNSGN